MTDIDTINSKTGEADKTEADNTSNDSLKTIAEIIRNNQNILLFPHVRPDGDAIGSCAALCHVLREMGKSCYVVSDVIPDNLKFLDKGYFVFLDNGLMRDMNGAEYTDLKSATSDLCISIDLSDLSRMGERKTIYEQGKVKIILDHHVSTGKKADFQHIDPRASASGEIIFSLIREMGIEIDCETGEAIFAAITTDTGNFQYSNTTKKTHEIIACLYDAGIDANKVSVLIYENEKPEKLSVSSEILNNIEFFADGKAVIASVTQEMLARHHAQMSDTEGIVQTLRSIAGVEISAFLKEKETKEKETKEETGKNKVKEKNQDKHEISVSMRVKRDGDVEKIAARHGGGGHVKAAGCTLKCSLDEAIEIIKKEITEEIKRKGSNQ